MWLTGLLGLRLMPGNDRQLEALSMLRTAICLCGYWGIVAVEPVGRSVLHPVPGGGWLSDYLTDGNGFLL